MHRTLSFQVHIDRCVSKNIFVGVMLGSSPLDNYVGADRGGWGYLANKAVWHNKGKAAAYGELFKEGDVIGVTLDLTPPPPPVPPSSDPSAASSSSSSYISPKSPTVLAPPGNAHGNGTLSFSRNGRPLGIAVSNLLAAVSPPDSNDNFGFGSGSSSNSGGNGGIRGRSPPRRGGGRGSAHNARTNSSCAADGGNISGSSSSRRRRNPPLLLYPAFSMYNRDDQISLLPSPFPDVFGSGAAAARAHAAAFAFQERQQQRLLRSRALQLHGASGSSPMAASGGSNGTSDGGAGAGGGVRAAISGEEGGRGGVAATLGGGTAPAEALVEGLATLADLFQALRHTDCRQHAATTLSADVPDNAPPQSDGSHDGNGDQSKPRSTHAAAAGSAAAAAAEAEAVYTSSSRSALTERFAAEPTAGASPTLLAAEAVRWWRKWRTGAHVAALTNEGLPLWCCTGPLPKSPQVKPTSARSAEGGNGNDGWADDVDSDGDEVAHAPGNAALAQLGLEAGDVIELSAAAPTHRREASSPPRAGAPRRALVLGTSGGKLWVAHASVTLAAAAAASDLDSGGGNSSSSGINSTAAGLDAEGGSSSEMVGNIGDVALWRSGVGSWAAASLAGCLPSVAAAGATASSTDTNIGVSEAENDTLKARGEAGPVLRLRAGGFCLGAEAWTYQAVADLVAGGNELLDRQGHKPRAATAPAREEPSASASASALRSPSSSGNASSSMHRLNNDHPQPQVRQQEGQQRVVASADLRQASLWFAQWTADMDNELSSCLEATLQACFDACAKQSAASTSTTASALALGARRALPFYLPFVLVEEATRVPYANDNSRASTDPFGPSSNFCMPPLLLQKWHNLAAQAPGGGRSVQLRAALLLSLNQRLAGLSRLVDWNRVGSSNEENCRSDENSSMNLSLPQLLAGGSAKRLLLRTKALVLTQRCAATAPDPPDTRLAPVVAWELCCGTALPPVLAPAAALPALAAESAALEAGDSEAPAAANVTVGGNASISATAEDDDVDDVRTRALPPVSFDACSPLVVPNRLVARRSPPHRANTEGSGFLSSTGHDLTGAGGASIPMSLRAAAPGAGGGASSSVPTLTLVVQSAEHFLQRHQTGLVPSVTRGSKSGIGALLGSTLGQVLRQTADLRPCDLRHQAASLKVGYNVGSDEAHGEEEKERQEDIDAGGETKACEDQVESPMAPCLWELQPRSFQVALVDPSGRRCFSSSSKGSVGQAALWRALLFAACRDAQLGPMPLLCPSLPLDGSRAPETPEAVASVTSAPTSSRLLGINPAFMRDDQRAARLGWYFGLGQVFGLALRTSVRLPLRLQPSLWDAIASMESAPSAAAAGAGITSTADGNAAQKWAASAAATAIASGLCTVVPRDVLVLLDGADLEALLALPSAASDALVATWTLSS